MHIHLLIISPLITGMTQLRFDRLCMCHLCHDWYIIREMGGKKGMCHSSMDQPLVSERVTTIFSSFCFSHFTFSAYLGHYLLSYSYISLIISLFLWLSGEVCNITNNIPCPFLSLSTISIL